MIPSTATNKDRKLAQILLASLLVVSLTNAAGAQYTVAPGIPVDFGYLPGSPANTIFNGPLNNSAVIYREFDWSGDLTSVGQRLTSSLDNNFRINGGADINLCCSGVVGRGSTLSISKVAQNPGFYFFDPGDHLTIEAWSDDAPDPFDPESGPVQSRMTNVNLSWNTAVNPSTFTDLGTFAPGEFNFATVPTMDPEDPDAAENDVLTEIAVFRQSDHTLVEGSVFSFGLGKYRDITTTLAEGDYYFAIGRANTQFSDRGVQAVTLTSFNPEGPIFNVELNDEPLITGGSLVRRNAAISEPQLFTFTVGDSTTTDGDFNEDGLVDGLDFLLWQRDPGIGNLSDWEMNYGAGQGQVSLQSVPEPSTTILLLSTLVMGSAMRRSKTIIC